jgi:hypothetical protein
MTRDRMRRDLSQGFNFDFAQLRGQNLVHPQNMHLELAVFQWGGFNPIAGRAARSLSS